MTDRNPSDPVPPITVVEDFAAKYQQDQRLLADARPINCAAVFAALAEAGVTHLIITFDGYGDSGQIEDIETKAGDETVDLPPTDVEWTAPVSDGSEPKRSRLALREAIENIVYDCLEETHGGWEIDEGSFGDLTFTVAERTITLDYNGRYTASEYSQHVF
jgi:hypothetical protein